MPKNPIKPNKIDKLSYLSLIPKLSSYGLVAIPLDGKKPILKKWNTLTKTPEKLYVFENHNIGVLTGASSGITVLDIDVKDGGIKLWKSFSSAYPEIKTPMVRTASGGLHIYFQYNKKLHSFSRFPLRGSKVGWDLMNNDRQVVVPNAQNTYTWITSPDEVHIITMPSWLEEYLLLCKSFK